MYNIDPPGAAADAGLLESSDMAVLVHRELMIFRLVPALRVEMLAEEAADLHMVDQVLVQKG